MSYVDYRPGARWAIEWLHDRARGMNDPHARAILNSAAYQFGNDNIERWQRLHGAPSESDVRAGICSHCGSPLETHTEPSGE